MNKIRFSLALALAILSANGLETLQAEEPSCKEKSTYLSQGPNPDPAYEYLEKLQANYYIENPSKLPERFLSSPLGEQWQMRDLAEKMGFMNCKKDDMECYEGKANLEKMLLQMQCFQFPTAYEPYSLHSMLDLYQRELQPALSKVAPKSIAAKFGTLPIRTIEAKVLRIPNSEEHLIILNRDVFNFASAFAKTIVGAVEIIPHQGQMIEMPIDPKVIKRRLKQHPEIVENYAQAMTYLVTGTPMTSRQQFLHGPHLRLYGCLLKGMESFILAHEQSHIVLLHTYFSDTKSFNLLGRKPKIAAKDATVELYSFEQQQELHADALGLALMINSQFSRSETPETIMLTMPGADVFFQLLEIADGYSQKYNVGQVFSDASHPKAAIRSQELDKIYQEYSTPDNGLSEADYIRKLFRLSLTVLNEVAEPIIRENLKNAQEKISGVTEEN